MTTSTANENLDVYVNFVIILPHKYWKLLTKYPRQIILWNIFKKLKVYILKKYFHFSKIIATKEKHKK